MMQNDNSRASILKCFRAKIARGEPIIGRHATKAEMYVLNIYMRVLHPD